MTPLWGALLAVLAGVCHWQGHPLCLAAAEAEPEAEVSEGEAGASTGADAASGDGAEAKGADFSESAKDLGEKLNQLRALLDAKGEDADPALKERLAGLQSQLSALGIGDALGGGGGSAIPSSPELTEFLSGCVAMSMRRVGVKRPSTLGALRRLVDGKMSPSEAAKVDLYRMIGVCVNEFTEDELTQFKAGKLTVLPKSYVDASKKPTAEEHVKNLDENIWKELRVIAAGLLKEIVGDTEQSQVPYYVGLLGAVPVVLMVGFLARKFFDMQREKVEKSEKKEKRSGKKSK